MKIRYTDMNIRFTIEHTAIDVLNIILERLVRPIPAHSHGSSSYEIHYIASGCGRLKADGRSCDIRPNTLYVTGPHVEHSQTPLLSDPMEEYCIYLKVRQSGGPRKTPLISAFTDVSFWFGQDTQQTGALIRQLFCELEHRYTGYRCQAEALLAQIVVSMVRNYEQNRARPQASEERPADNKALLIEEYFLYEYQSLSLEDLAKRLNLSARQTQRLLREYYGKTFQQKKAEARMSAAAVLLEDRRQSITSVASLLGYSSAEHFSSAFRKYYGQSPRAYRKSAL